MIHATVWVGGVPFKAMVDTGCSWPMAIPKVVADWLVSKGFAVHTSPAKSMLADGSVHDADVVVINSITVEGRTLQDVVATVGPSDTHATSDTAPLLLGLGALNRLGQYSITDGRIVFTGDQPA